jgi:hypothetical protein
MKTVRKSDKRFDLQNILNFPIFVINMMRSTLLLFSVLVLIKRLDYMHDFVLGAQGLVGSLIFFIQRVLLCSRVLFLSS